MSAQRCETHEIALLNDSLRRTFTGGKVVMTDGVTALPEGGLSQLLERVWTFADFTWIRAEET